MVKVVFLVEESPFVGEVSVPPDGLVKVFKDIGGYSLTSFNAEGEIVNRVDLAHSRG